MFSFVSRCDCVEVAAEDTLCGKGYELTLFLFTDVLLIAKKKETCRYLVDNLAARCRPAAPYLV